MVANLGGQNEVDTTHEDKTKNKKKKKKKKKENKTKKKTTTGPQTKQHKENFLPPYKALNVFSEGL